MKIKPVVTDLAKLLMLAMLGVAINPEYNLGDASLLSVFVFCLIFGIPVFYFHNRYWISYWRRHKKRKELLRIQGYYQTIDSTAC